MISVKIRTLKGRDFEYRFKTREEAIAFVSGVRLVDSWKNDILFDMIVEPAFYVVAPPINCRCTTESPCIAHRCDPDRCYCPLREDVLHKLKPKPTAPTRITKTRKVLSKKGKLLGRKG